MITDSNTSSLKVLERVVSRLMKITPDGERARLTVPVLYPSGASAAVEVIFNKENCFVSDIALGQVEAEMHGAASFYDASARKSAERFGVGYDGLSIFKLWSSIEKIESAIITVANASAFAATSAIYKAVEDKDNRKNDELFERVSKLFGRQRVHREKELVGRDAPWPAHNVVDLSNDKSAVFEFVSNNQNSIASKFMMFSDLGKVEDRFILNAVVNKLELIGKKGAMIADVATMVEINAEDQVFLKRAA
jgi:hypothetical protein